MQVDSTTYAPRVEVDLAGLAPAEFTEHIRERITNLDHHAPDPILRATVGFSTPTARGRHLVIARATADVSRTQLTAHASGATVHEAAEDAMNALRRKLVQLSYHRRKRTHPATAAQTPSGIGPQPGRCGIGTSPCSA